MSRLESIIADAAFLLNRHLSRSRQVLLSVRSRGLSGTIQVVSERLRSRTARPTASGYLELIDPESALEIPSSEHPRVSIIIPARDYFRYTWSCLASIARSVGPTPFEVVVVDDASSDLTERGLLNASGIRVLRTETNSGFIAACNKGSSVARGDYLVFLNNDTHVTPGWLECLLESFDEFPGTGLVGAKLIYPDGVLQEAGGVVFSDGRAWNYGRFEDADDPRFNYAREADYCSGACLMIARELFESLGGFDAIYAPAYYEDTDLAFHVRSRGLRVIYQPRARVFHHEGITSGTDLDKHIKRFQALNRETFVERWKERLSEQPPPGADIEIAKQWRTKRRVLVIDVRTPTPDQDSGSLRLVNIMRIARDLGCSLTFLPDDLNHLSPYTEDLQRSGIEVLHSPFVASPARYLRSNGSRFDTIWVCRYYLARRYAGLVRRHCPRACFVLDTVDLHHVREERLARLKGRRGLDRLAARTKAAELEAVSQTDITLVVSPIERRLLTAALPSAQIEVLPNVFNVPGCGAPFDSRRDILFLGGFEHPPNVDAVRWFTKDILPLVRAEIPDVTLFIVGSRMTDSVRRLQGCGITVVGHASDLRPFLDSCRLSVAPLRYGAGVKGKISLSMSCGLPVVATSSAAEGMSLCDGRDVLLADDAQEFARAVVLLYGSEKLWNRLSRYGIEHVECHFSRQAVLPGLRRVLRLSLH